jgi:putative transposase
MYSYEDRLRAVELYIKLGKCVRLTIRQLGYPTKNALKGWYQAYARDVRPPPRAPRCQADPESLRLQGGLGI